MNDITHDIIFLLIKAGFEQDSIEKDFYYKNVDSDKYRLFLLAHIEDYNKPLVSITLSDVGGEYHLGKGKLSEYRGAILSEDDFASKLSAVLAIVE
jgi:hypothetical protein